MAEAAGGSKSDSRKRPRSGEAESVGTCSSGSSTASASGRRKATTGTGAKATPSPGAASSPASAGSSAFAAPGHGGEMVGCDPKTTIVDRSSFVKSSPRGDGRAARCCFPVLQHWRNERIIYERTRGSPQPSVSAVQFVPLTTPAPRRRADASKRQRLSPVKGALKRRRGEKSDEPLSRRLWPDDSEHVECAVASPRLPKSALRCRSHAEEELLQLTRRFDGSSGQRVAFAGDPAITRIEKWSGPAEKLWYSDFAVECDICEQPVKWGHEGSLMGEPGRSRFSQWRVLCNTCLADQIYAEMGAWLTVSLAARSEGQSGTGVDMASGPVTCMLDRLVDLSPHTGLDLLASLMGKEVEAPCRAQLHK